MTNTFWPTPQEYNEAIQNPSVCIADADLAAGTVETNQLGLPKSMSGAFASVYKITTSGKAWAVRCFLSYRKEQQERYRHISEFVLMDDLECTIDFHYIENGIKIRNEWFPILKMPWVEGDTLDRYVLKNYKNTELMKTLLSDFHSMMAELARAQISHGDLQHGNILVSPDGLRLVDYDALFVPALAGKKSLEVGHPSFQHPERTAKHYNKDVDNFSAWLIHTGLMAIAIDSELYEKYCNGDDNLLFRRGDLSDPEASELFNSLSTHTSENIKAATHLIRRMLWSAPIDVPRLNAPAEELERLAHAKTDKVVGENEDESRSNESVTENSDQTADQNLPQAVDFSWIDEEAAIARASAKTVQKPTVWNRAVAYTATGVDKFYLWFSTYSWVERNMNLAKVEFDKGDYEAASKIYHKIYKTLEEHNHSELDAYSICLLRLGSCYRASNTPSLASNYFLLSLQNARSVNAAKPALYLALLRFQSGDEAGALRLLTEHVKSNSEIKEIVSSELRHMLLDRTSLFDLLLGFCELAMKDDLKLDLCADGIYCTWLVLQSLIQTNSIETIDPHLEKILNLLALLKNTSKVTQTYESISDFFGDSQISNKGAIAYLCTSLRDHADRSKPEPGSVNASIRRLSRTKLSKTDLDLLKKSALAMAEPDHVRDIMLRISKVSATNNYNETASATLKFAFDLTAEFGLTPTFEMLSDIKNPSKQVDCLESIMWSENAFQHLILYIGNNDEHFQLVVAISKYLVKKGRLQQLAHLVNIIKYGCPEAVFNRLCRETELLDERRAEIELLFEKNSEALMELLNSIPKKKEQARK